MNEVIFLGILSLVWVIFAVIQDLRKKEISDWLNFSLIIFAMGFRFFYSLFSGNFSFFYQGLIGLGIFFILHELFYHSRFFAGGDAKLMMALGAILPLSTSFFSNLKLFGIFFVIFFIVAMIYTLSASVFLSIKNFNSFKKEFKIQLRKNRRLFFMVMVFALVLMILGFFNWVFFPLGILFFLVPLSYLYTKAIDECCMIKKISTKKLTEGDWLYKDIKIGKKVIKANWDGVGKDDIMQIKKKYRDVKIRTGISFSPVFLISLIVFFLFYFLGIMESFLVARFFQLFS